MLNFNFEKVIFYDGGMGTMLMKRGMGPGMRSDMMSIQHPEVVEGIHREYAEAGSQIVCTNTFTSCSETLAPFGISAEQMITTAVTLAKKAVGDKAAVSMDIGPVGELMEPYGDLSQERAYKRFAEQAVLGEKAGADMISIETMSDITELRTAIEAALENTRLDIFATMTFAANGRTFTGAKIEDFASYINDTPVLAAGINCSKSPEEMYPAAEKLAAILKKPLIIKLNAGLPDISGNYSVSPEEYGRQMEKYKDLNVRVVGGCCGTTPEYIKVLTEVFGK